MSLSPLAALRTLAVLLMTSLCFATRAQEIAAVEFEKETLDNGLRVIYAPLNTAPVVHVRVLYNVGSRDERPDRQGFAHMFEHMMFRGSAHVPNEVHMKLINGCGGDSNAFTSFDQTTYVNTIPANQLEMALYLEADRMAGFKVTDDHFKIERGVVAEEWRLRYANQPYGPLFADFAKTAFTKHSYRWTPIGDMDQLRQASSSELQEFWNTYYVPNNACLIVAGDIDVAKTKQWVRKYYGFIPKGAEIKRLAEIEPEQTEARRLEVFKRSVPVTRIMIGYKNTDYRNDDHYALTALGQILSGGRSARLDERLVYSADPLCAAVQAGNQQLQDQSLFITSATVKPGKDYKKVEEELNTAIAEVLDKGVTQDELNKALKSIQSEIIQQRETCTQIATNLGQEEVFGGDANRVNTEWSKFQALTPGQIQEVAKKYLLPQRSTTIVYLPDPLGKNSKTAEQAEATRKAEEAKNAGVVASTQVVEPRKVDFPADFPQQPPVTDANIAASFKKGEEIDVNGIKLIVMTDKRLPLVNFSLIMRSGSYAEPKDKVGVASMTAAMMRKGSAGIDFLKFSADLESRDISIEASDASDNTRLSGSCTSDQLDYAIAKAREVLLQPNFPENEFKKLQQQTLVGLMQSLSNPSAVVNREFAEAMWGDMPLGRSLTPQLLQSITLDDVKKWYEQVYRPNNAILVFSGDIEAAKAKELAAKLVEGWKPAEALPDVKLTLPEATTSRKIVLIDNPDGKQSVVRMAVPAYTIRSEEKYSGSVISRILSDGIESLLNRYVRAEKGLTYGCSGYFQATRQYGLFNASVETNPDTTAAAIEAMIKVFNDVRSAPVSASQLADGQRRVTGSMVMEMQTIGQQAGRRVDVELNDYPHDYFDVYSGKINAVTSDQLKDVMSKYVDPSKFVIVVVAPAEKVKAQLETLGEVKVLEMPMKRLMKTPTADPGEMMKKKDAA
jgi:zinc protease